MRTQNAIVENLERVQTRNDKNFFLLGAEIKGTQESVRKLKEVVGVPFKQLEFYHVNASYSWPVLVSYVTMSFYDRCTFCKQSRITCTEWEHYTRI